MSNKIDISNCPKSGLPRKAWKHEFVDANDYLKLTVRVGFFNADGEQIITNGINEFEKELFAVNSTKVNALTGDNVYEGDQGYENSVGEMDYIRGLKLNPAFIEIGNIATINAIIYDQYIIKSDQNGRFNE